MHTHLGAEVDSNYVIDDDRRRGRPGRLIHLHPDALLFDDVLDEAGSELRRAEVEACTEGVHKACLA